MEQIIIFTEKFHQSIENLIEILYDKEYFGFRIDCHIYSNKIYDFVKLNIDKPISKNAPKKFKKHGENYLKYKANNRTTWYIFFDEKDGKYLVNYIINNHSHNFSDLM